MASFVLSVFPLDVLDEIRDLLESVSEGFLTYSSMLWYHLIQLSYTSMLWYHFVQFSKTSMLWYHLIQIS